MVMINFEIEPEYDQKLNELARKTERSKSGLLRKIIKDYFFKQE